MLYVLINIGETTMSKHYTTDSAFLTCLWFTAAQPVSCVFIIRALAYQWHTTESTDAFSERMTKIKIKEEKTKSRTRNKTHVVPPTFTHMYCSYER